MANTARDPSLSPKFFITIEAIESTRDAWVGHGVWKPWGQPAEHRAVANRRRLCFFFNGRRTIAVRSIQEESTIFKSSTLYHHSEMLWTVSCDVRQIPFESESESGSEDGSGSEDERGEETQTAPGWLDWVQPTFMLFPQDQSSYVGYRMPFPRLLAQRSDQEWVRYVLPSRYRAEPQNQLPRNSGRGGLIGELPLLIGLLVMSIPNRDNDIVEHLPRMIEHDNRGWACWSHGTNVQRRIGWLDGRGIVVTVHYDGSDMTAREHLERYEGGQWGKLLR